MCSYGRTNDTSVRCVKVGQITRESCVLARVKWLFVKVGHKMLWLSILVFPCWILIMVMLINIVSIVHYSMYYC